MMKQMFSTGRKKKPDLQPTQDEEFLRVPDNDDNVNKQRGQQSKDIRAPATPINNIPDAIPQQVPDQMVDYSDDEGDYIVTHDNATSAVASNRLLLCQVIETSSSWWLSL